MASETGRSARLNVDGSVVNLREATQDGPRIGREYETGWYTQSTVDGSVVTSREATQDGPKIGREHGKENLTTEAEVEEEDATLV